MRKEPGCRGIRAAVVVAALLLLPLAAGAAELTVAGFVDLTIDRLELAHQTWSQEGRSPVETEEAEVCRLHQTDLATYYGFAGSHRQQIEDYLAENAEARATIESLTAAIDRLIEQKEAQ
jgi:hypothetical protein